jgi:predicted AAA+ superfamily ATPase
MDSVLTKKTMDNVTEYLGNTLTLHDIVLLQDESNEYDELLEENVSLWVKNKDVIIPSMEITILKKLEPGFYKVDYNRDEGLYAKKLVISSDALFKFTESVSQPLLNEISNFWTKAKVYEENKLVHKRGILLAGFPGTGKSSIISILCKDLIQSGGVIFKVSNFRNLENYVDFIKHSFRKIQPSTPIITIIEDLDQYEEVEVELLDFLDGQASINHHVLIATSNNTERIPDTFLRPSRLDLIVEIPYPSELTRLEYFQYKGIESDKINELVEKSNNFSIADLKELYICVYLLDYTVDDAVKKIKSPKEKKNYLEIKNNSKKLGF